MPGKNIPQEKQEQILLLHGQGNQPWQIQKETGVDLNTIRLYINPEKRERVRERQRIWRRRHRTICVDCGFPTASDKAKRCKECSQKNLGYAKIGKGPLQKRILEYLQDRGPASRAEIRESLALTPGQTRYAITFMMRQGLIKRVKYNSYTVA